MEEIFFLKPANLKRNGSLGTGSEAIRLKPQYFTEKIGRLGFVGPRAHGQIDLDTAMTYSQRK